MSILWHQLKVFGNIKAREEWIEVLVMKWKILGSESLFSAGLFHLKADRCELPDGRVMPRYFVMDFPDWVNVLPMTENHEALLIKQYRHASKEVHIEIPGGSMDPRLNENAEQAARRELLEETGFDCQEMIAVGSHFPNPALQSNCMHTFLARGCFEKQEQKLDAFEDLEIYRCSLEQLKDHIRDGDIDHSLMLASLLKCLQWMSQNS
ncbi:MAG: NUDIX hydrolase [Pseudomonadota bacterium]